MADQPEKSAKIMSSVALDKAIIQQLSDALKRNQTDKQWYMQQLQESQKDFDITTQNLETDWAIFRKQIIERFEADLRQTKNAQHSKNVSETNLSSPAPSQPCPSQSMAGSLPTSDTSTVSTSSVAHYRAKLKVIKKKLVKSQKAAAAEVEDVLKKNQTDKQRYMQQVLDSLHSRRAAEQKGFDITTQNLETEQAIFQKQIEERFEADLRQTKNAQHSKNVETNKELQKQQENLDTAKIAVELTVKQN